MTSNGTYRASRAFEEFSAPCHAPYCDVVAPADFPQAVLRYRNQRAAETVGLADLDEAAWIAHFARFAPLPDNQSAPLALRYHGHQFRQYNPEIGDGRGFLFAQLYDGEGRLLDFGTKGSGQTPYSRFGDGRLTLKGGVREILAAEMLEALGVYTSKAFSLIETGEKLYRNDEPSPTRSAVLVRLSHSHIRFGAFQRLAAEKNDQALAALVDYCVTHFDSDLAEAEPHKKAIAFYERVCARTARLAAQWMAAGFVHGVLNTDNMNVTGESFDYGPWRFLPVMDPGFTAAYFDQTGLYAYGRQAEAAAWNLSRLGGALLALATEQELNAALESFYGLFQRQLVRAFCQRLGVEPGDDQEAALNAIQSLLAAIQGLELPFEQVMFDWYAPEIRNEKRALSPIGAAYRDEAFVAAGQAMKGLAPSKTAQPEAAYFAGLCPKTMLIEEMEAIWDPIAENDDWTAFHGALAEIDQMRRAYGFAQQMAPLA